MPIEPARFVGERRVDGEVVDLRQHFVDGFDRLDAQLLRSLARQERIVAEHLHLERQRPLGDGQADAAQADDAERLAGHLRAHVLVAVPLAGRCRLWYAGAMFRDRASISAIVCSAVLSVLPAGVFITTMPARVAASLSMLSVPTPARTIAFSRRLPSSDSARDLHAAAADRAVELGQRLAQARRP